MLKNFIFLGFLIILSLRDSLAALHSGDEGFNVEMILIPETNLQIPLPHQEIHELFTTLDGITNGQAQAWYPYFLNQGQDLWISSNTAAGAYLGIAASVQFFETDRNARKQIMSLIYNFITHFRELNVPDTHIPAFLSLSTLCNFVTNKDQEITNLSIQRRRGKRRGGASSSNTGQYDDQE